GTVAGAARARQPGRSDGGVLVRPRRPRACRDLPLGGLDPRPLARRRDPRERRRARPVRGHRPRAPRSPRRPRAAGGQAVTVEDGPVQYRVVVGKRDERVAGPDGAAIVVSVPLVVAAADGFDATVEFMRGNLKAAG